MLYMHNCQNSEPQQKLGRLNIQQGMLDKYDVSFPLKK